jgi:hypothetical protein
MPTFTRSFDFAAFAAWYSKNPNSAVHELLKRWALPGAPAVGDVCLRLAVRGGYLNFYVKGQSVAKLSCGLNGPTVAVHNAYVDGRVKGMEQLSPRPAQDYVTYSAEALADPSTVDRVAGWVRTAETYASAEKRFVDDLVAANAGVVDLEMGLPASDLPGSERVAPRMDLVLVEIGPESEPAIVFWEAKCANNGELRATGDAPPRVRDQITRYVDWLSADGRMSQVRQAYRAAAAVLIDLYRLRCESDQSSSECIGFWTALANCVAPHVVAQPGVVIGNYWPEGSNEGIASERMRQCAMSFERKGHREKLENEGIRLHQVGPDARQPVLPYLATSRLAA